MANQLGLKDKVDNSAETEKNEAKIFTRSGYPNTFAGNIKVLLNLLFHFIS